MNVAVCRCVDDDQHRLQPAAWTLGCGIGPAVLCAQINGGIGWDAARSQLGELRLAIVRKGDIVAHEGRVARIGQHGDGEGRKGSIRALEPRASFGRGLAETPLGKSGGISCQQHGLRLHGRSIG